ncbi:hypothetical protein BDW42DRAFT_202233 [Aspergillus taichungensis]|uniref:Uncharacterized protein n=1 Tax=Aspergillus taichungensis TaxID=482145 RepID=A0A2J5HM17_9EURO|nr:hypothetical protein BDW42DRAFT_202233 [Aspergillus taichungensis]
MRISALLLALAANVSLGSACTFEFSALRNFNTGDLSGGLACFIAIRRSDDNERDKEADLSEKISCSEGCKTVKYFGAEYEFCHNGLGEIAAFREGATVQRKGGGTKVNIHPDGEHKKNHDQNPFSSMISNYYWRSNILC